ncbi:ABC transporter substrate-binding protein [Rhodoferax koreense]|uniref:ABC transporter substrate-binding protein n=1 Tax=Rhodoferax koreensis TaxID=1842727 RepID=A0A1P8K2F1_9BURK|nr:tripartite tricarboxylate transporter substrate binding protein [Rhodoferax koreense]APW40179.1 ABC transporter substrate-binding protein [Rhodoferax koreense]
MTRSVFAPTVRRDRRTLLALGGLAMLARSPLALAQTYPAKPIKLIVPFPPGGGGDTLARLVMTRAAKELGQPIVIENLAGAGGNIGSQTATRAAADGYTLLYGTNGTHAINQTLYRNSGFDAVRDFEPVSQLTRIAAMVVVRPGLPANTMPELLKLLKASPGRYTFASAGNGTTSHLAGEILKSRTGLSIVHIPYRGGGPAMTDLLGGQVDLLIDVMPSTAPQVRAGKLRGLAVTTAKRVPAMPEVPTIAESGVPGFDVSAWDAVFAPAHTPATIVAQLNEAIRKAVNDPELRAQLIERGAEAAPGTPAELGQFVKSEIVRWGEAVKRSGASIE